MDPRFLWIRLPHDVNAIEKCEATIKKAVQTNCHIIINVSYGFVSIILA